MPAEIPTLADLEAVIERVIRRVVREERNESLSPFLGTSQAARVAGVSSKTIRKWIADGQVESTMRGKLLVIERSHLEAFLRGHSPRKARTVADSIVETLK